MKTKKEIKGFFKRNFTLIAGVFIVILITGLFFQNSRMLGKMNRILNDSDTTVHDIYDDTKVINAYKNGSGEGLDEEEAFLYDTLVEVIPEITKEGMSDYEKEKAAYDWVFGVTHFNAESLNPMNAGRTDDNYTPYGVIRNHDAICVGNATTFKLFMDAMDIPCKIVHSTEQGEHAWNVVKLDDDWYHVDLTFDGGSGEPSYANFNVPDSMKDDGSWPYDHKAIPECRGTKYCYLLMNAKELGNMYEIPGAIAAVRDAGGGALSFTLKDAKGLTTSIAQYIGEGINVNNGEVAFTGMYALDGKNVLVYEIDYYNESSQVPADILEKLSPAMDKANEGVFDDFDGSEEYEMKAEG